MAEGSSPVARRPDPGFRSTSGTCFSRQISLIGSYIGSKGELLRPAELFFDGRFTPVVDCTYPLEAVAAAQGRLEDKAQFGKIVLEV